MSTSRTRNILDDKNNHISTLKIACAVLICLNLIAFWGWKSSPNSIRVDIPPDIRNGSTQIVNQRLPTTIYSFATYIFQQLNRWPKNGDQDYVDRIDTLRNYLTPACFADRKHDFETKKINGELRNRERIVSEIPGRGYSASRVFVESPESWIVYLDLQVMETLTGEPVKNTYVRYPLRVVRYEIDGEGNPYGLAIDCFSEDPKRIEVETPPVKTTEKAPG